MKKVEEKKKRTLIRIQVQEKPNINIKPALYQKQELIQAPINLKNASLALTLNSGRFNSDLKKQRPSKDKEEDKTLPVTRSEFNLLMKKSSKMLKKI